MAAIYPSHHFYKINFCSISFRSHLDRYHNPCIALIFWVDFWYISSWNTSTFTIAHWFISHFHNFVLFEITFMFSGNENNAGILCTNFAIYCFRCSCEKIFANIFRDTLKKNETKLLGSRKSLQYYFWESTRIFHYYSERLLRNMVIMLQSDCNIGISFFL